METMTSVSAVHGFVGSGTVMMMVAWWFSGGNKEMIVASVVDDDRRSNNTHEPRSPNFPRLRRWVRGSLSSTTVGTVMVVGWGKAMMRRLVAMTVGWGNKGGCWWISLGLGFQVT